MTKATFVPEGKPTPRNLETPLGGLLEASAGGEPLTVRFPKPLPAYSRELIEALGGVIEIDPRAPVLSVIRSSGRSKKTRRDLTEAERDKMRESYYARPDKQGLPRDDA